MPKSFVVAKSHFLHCQARLKQAICCAMYFKMYDLLHMSGQGKDDRAIGLGLYWLTLDREKMLTIWCLIATDI